MKKLLAALALLSTTILVACGPSKLRIQEMSSECDVSIEIRQVLDDSISYYAGNMFFFNVKQTIPDEWFPMEASVRDPMNIEVRTRTDKIESSEAFMEYLRRGAPQAVTFGIVIGENAADEVGFDEASTVAKLKDIFKTLDGAVVYLFHEKGGELTSAKKIL